jgi:hypothetical protein
MVDGGARWRVRVRAGIDRGGFIRALDVGEDHVWFEDRWMVASLCDE